jgi:hypothetical protein
MESGPIKCSARVRGILLPSSMRSSLRRCNRNRWRFRSAYSNPSTIQSRCGSDHHRGCFRRQYIRRRLVALRRPCAPPIRFVSSRQSCKMWPIITTSAWGSACSRKLPGKNFTRPEIPLASAYSSKIGPTSGRSKPIPSMYGLANAPCVIRSPWAVPTSKVVRYLFQGNLRGIAWLAPWLTPVIAHNGVSANADDTTQEKIAQAMYSGPDNISKSARIIDTNAQGNKVTLR